MKLLTKLKQQRWIEIIVSLIAIIVFFTLYSLIGKFCFKNWLKSLFDICITISTSSLFYFIGKKVNNDSFKRDLTERYIYDFRHIKYSLDKNEQSLKNHYNKEERGSVQNYNYYQLILENNRYIFDDLDEESLSLYHDLKAKRVDFKVMKNKIYQLLNKMLNNHKDGLSHAKHDVGPYYNFKNPIRVLKELNKNR